MGSNKKSNPPGGKSAIRLFLVLLLCVSCGGGGVIPDDPDNPDSRLIGSIDTTCAEDIVVHGDILYVADGPAGLIVIDISDESNPALLRNIPTTYAIRVYIYEEHLYLCDASAGIKVYSLSTPSSPVLTYSEDTEWTTSAAFSNGHLYLGDYFGGLRIYSVADPANPELVLLKENSIIRDLTIQDDTLYISNVVYGLETYLIESPTDLIWLYNDSSLHANYEDIVIWNEFAMTARNDEASSISVFYDDGINGIARVNEIKPARFIDGLTGSDEFLIVACGEDGVIGYPITSLPQLNKLWQINTPGYSRRAKMCGEFIYVADMSSVGIYQLISTGGGGQ